MFVISFCKYLDSMYLYDSFKFIIELKKILDNFSKYFNKWDIKDLYFSLVLSVVSVWNELDFSTINVFIFELSSKLFCLFSSEFIVFFFD